LTHKELLAGIPNLPGCYLMFDSQGEVIYVGKAKNLLKRVSSYFSRITNSIKTEALVDKIVNISTIITNNEVEALLLEDTLIKKYSPKYNIDLKDNKRYPLLKIDMRETYPRLEIVRIRKEEEGVLYFGPYGSSITETLKLLNRLFPLVKCVNYQRQKGCLFKDMGRCLAPCVNKDGKTKKHYAEILQEVIIFLSGKGEILQEKWKEIMQQRSSQMRYEEAAQWRDKINLLGRVLTSQTVVGDMRTFDLWVTAGNKQYLVYYLFKVRSGRLSGEYHQKFRQEDIVEEEALSERVLFSYYKNNFDRPAEIFLPWKLESIKAWLAESEFNKITPETPLVDLAQKNAMLLITDERTVLLKELQQLLSLATFPEIIECYDISTLQGKNTVASKVVFENGLPNKELYRHYLINSVEAKPDDFQAMREVLTRRMQDPEKLPDLIILDGGKGQLSVGLQALQVLGQNIPVVALAKREEIIYLANKGELKLPLETPLMKMIIRLRNEAHRFAITFHRSKRNKRFFKSKLDGIRGLGPKNKQKLLKYFGSVDNIRKASVNDLAKVINTKLAAIIKEQLP
jgi:excinuclease ABC subunit C